MIGLDFETVADFWRNNGKAIPNVCRQSFVLCQELDLCTESIIATDSAKFNAVNNRDRNFTRAKPNERIFQIE
jgi:transposase